MNALIYSALIIILIFSGCSGKKSTAADSLKISVKHTYIYAWLNLMPGGPSSFHITGNLRITNDDNSSVNNITLSEVIIYQDNAVIYKISPVFETIHREEDYFLKKNEVKEFRFSTDSRLSISPELESDNSIDAELIFSSEGKTFEYIIKDILIEKTY
jgi:hypothetical protein